LPASLSRITDISGIRVGHAEDERVASGVTALVFDTPCTCAVDVRGGGPGTRETDLLDPAATVQAVDALVLSGGSAFGLDAAAGVVAYLREAGRGFAVGNVRVPIVPGAILFDLLNGGDKAWGRYPPYRDLGYAAAENACGGAIPLGSVGAGFGARTANLKGGLGSASSTVPGLSAQVGALVAVNAFGRVTMGQGPHFWAAPFERDGEFGGLGLPAPLPNDALSWPRAPLPGANTTLAVVAHRRGAHQGAGQAPRHRRPGRPRPGDPPGPHPRSTATWCSPSPPERCRSGMKWPTSPASVRRRRRRWRGRSPSASTPRPGCPASTFRRGRTCTGKNEPVGHRGAMPKRSRARHRRIGRPAGSLRLRSRGSGASYRFV
jgi:hypothetical protein